jgi:outer membrane protein assembly factor BamB
MPTTRRHFAAALPAFALGPVLVARNAAAQSASPVASPVAASGGVPMFHVDPAHTGVNPGPGPVANPEVLWSFETGGHRSSPAVVGGTVYAGSLDGFLYALDAATGAERWRFEIGGYVDAPGVVGDIVITSGNGALYALDAATGEEIWNATDDAPSLFSDPTIADGVLYVGAYSGAVYAIDPTTGDLAWSYPTAARAWLPPAVAGDTAFARSDDGLLHAIDAATGTPRWTATIGWNNESSSPAVADGIVYVGGADGIAWALDAATGAEVWSATLGDIVDLSPAIGGGLVYAGFDGVAGSAVVALDAATGDEAWRVDLPGKIGSSVSLASGAAYFGDRDGVLHCVDAASGEVLWTLQTDDGQAISTPAIVDGIVYIGGIGSETHHLWAIIGDTQ